MDNKKTLLIIDSNALLHRAFHALPPLTTKEGAPTGAVYGFLMTMFKAIKDLNANYVVACFDTKSPTFRHEKFKEYKAQRPKMAEPLVLQLPPTKEILKAMEIPVFEKDGVEADDLIATISKKALEQDDKIEVYIVSGDLDNLQLVEDRIKVYTLGKGIKETVIYDINKVRERFLVEPGQMNDLKSLTGDASDNVPGVKGIGKKTASDLINQFGSIENLYAEIMQGMADIKERLKDMLIEGKQSAFLSKDLVKMKKDVDIDFDINSCKFGAFDKNNVIMKLKKLEFNTLINRLEIL